MIIPPMRANATKPPITPPATAPAADEEEEFPWTGLVGIGEIVLVIEALGTGVRPSLEGVLSIAGTRK